MNIVSVEKYFSTAIILVAAHVGPYARIYLTSVSRLDI